jgi:aspartokinase/homoserine dehydrogenase 1
MVLAKELGLDRNMSYDEIQRKSDVIATIPDVEERDYRMFEGATDEQIKERARLASEKGCVLRHVASVDVASQSIDIRILEVPKNHDFAIAPPSSACVRLYTQRYQPYPLLIAGPAAGADCTSSALLAELLNLMSTKIGPTSGVLSRTSSGAHLS